MDELRATIAQETAVLKARKRVPKSERVRLAEERFEFAKNNRKPIRFYVYEKVLTRWKNVTRVHSRKDEFVKIKQIEKLSSLVKNRQMNEMAKCFYFRNLMKTALQALSMQFEVESANDFSKSHHRFKTLNDDDAIKERFTISGKISRTKMMLIKSWKRWRTGVELNILPIFNPLDKLADIADSPKLPFPDKSTDVEYSRSKGSRNLNQINELHRGLAKFAIENKFVDPITGSAAAVKKIDIDAILKEQHREYSSKLDSPDAILHEDSKLFPNLFEIKRQFHEKYEMGRLHDESQLSPEDIAIATEKYGEHFDAVDYHK